MTAHQPSLRRDLNIGTSWLLPEWSSGPSDGDAAVVAAARGAGYAGVQGVAATLCRDAGLAATTFDIRTTCGGLAERARRWVDDGYLCSTLMMGTGLEDDDIAARLVDEVLEASASAGIPLYIETHRATITQDIWRTLQLVERFPELRFNGDFSHWYTAHDLASRGFDAMLEVLAPVVTRTRYLHGRLATAGCIQVDIEHAGDSLAHFRELWTRVFVGFLTSGQHDPVPAPHDQIGFAPELLAGDFGYALRRPTADGTLVETSDRWQQAIELCDIAAECFADAQVRVAEAST